MLKSGNWERIADLNEPKCWSNPCLFHDYVYLYGSESLKIEAFDLRKETFSVLLSTDFIGRNGFFLLVSKEEDLVIHQSNQVFRFRKGPGEQLVDMRQGTSNFPTKIQHSPPLVLGNHYFVIYEEVAYKVDWSTGNLSDKFK